MTGICHNHRPQNNPWHHEEEKQNTDCLNTIKVKQPSKMIAQLESTLRSRPQNKIPTQNLHSQWEQLQTMIKQQHNHYLRMDCNNRGLSNR